MSLARSRNKMCLSLDNSSNNASSHTAHLNRWSEVVPPKTALTFAALWDPQEGMVTFSGAGLLEADGPSDTSPHPAVFFDDDDLAQFVSVDRDATTTNDNTATLATFQDAFKAFLHRTPWSSREHLQTTTKSGSGWVTPRDYGLHTRASSTLDGLDIYSHDMQPKPRRSLRSSYVDLLNIESSFRTPSVFGKLRLRSDLMLDAYRTEPENVLTAAGNRPCLISRFSSTTTSTSNYIDVAPSTLQTMRVSETTTVVAPKWTLSKDPAGSWPFLPRRRRLLRKRRSPSGGDNVAAASSNSLPDTPRKASMSASPSPLSLSTTVCLSSSPSAIPSPPTTLRKERRGRLRRTCSASKPMTPMPPLMPTSTTSASAAAAAPAVTPSNSKTPRIKLFRLALLLPKWKKTPRTSRRSRRWTSLDLNSGSDSDSDGWVYIDITPTIRQRYVSNLDKDDGYEC